MGATGPQGPAGVDGITSFNTRTGAITLTSADVTNALTFTPYNATNPAGYQTAAQVAAAIPASSSAAPIMDSVAAAGSATTWSRGDHVHPTDTSRYAASNPSGYQTAAQVTSALAPYALTSSVPVASAALPLIESGTGAIGTSAAYARADHVHPAAAGGAAVTISDTPPP
jgi:hypothetical protein